MKTAILFACLVSAAAASPARAQSWGHGAFPRDGVCFYKDPDFRGEYFCAAGNENLSSVPKDMNDEISSMKLFGNVEVTLFKDVQFQGRSSKFGSDIRDMKREGWDDQVSSIRVRMLGSAFPGRPGEDPDRIVTRAYREILSRDPDPVGMRTYRRHIIDDGWSEGQVRDALRNSPEYRQKNVAITPAQAQDIVRRAYLDVLKREPDAAGSRGYVDRVLRDHWTQDDVERELRKSPEYRGRR